MADGAGGSSTYYVHVGDQAREVGATELCILSEHVPGTAFASEVAVAVRAGGARHIRVSDDPVERNRLAEACSACVRWRPWAVHTMTLLELYDLLTVGA